MHRLAIKGNSKYAIALLLSSAVLLILLLNPGSALGLEVTVNTDKGVQPGETALIISDVSLQGGEIREITGVKLFITGPVNEEVDLPFSADQPVNNQFIPLNEGSLLVSMEPVSLDTVDQPGGGTGYVGQLPDGGALRFILGYTPPTSDVATYTVRIEVYVEESLLDSAETTFKVLLEPDLEVLDTVYPVAGGQVDRLDDPGSDEAIPGDLVILQVSTSVLPEDMESLMVSSGSNALGQVAEGLEFIPAADFHPALLAKWGVSPDADYILPVRIPGQMLVGNRLVDISLVDNAGQSAGGSASLNIVAGRSAFADYLMPGLNFLSTPLQSDEPDNNFDIVTLLSQDVSQYVDADFLAGLGGTALLSDVVETISSYPGGPSATTDFLIYTTGPSVDDNFNIGVGHGYILRAKAEAFNQLGDGNGGDIPQPVPMIFSGQVLVGDTPLTFPVVADWNLVGPHTETNTLTDRFLAGANVPTRTWESLFEYLNGVEARTIDGAVQGNPADSLEYIGGQIRARFGGRPGVPEGDRIRVGSGLWLLMSQDDELGSVLDRDVADNGED